MPSPTAHLFESKTIKNKITKFISNIELIIFMAQLYEYLVKMKLLALKTYWRTINPLPFLK